MCKYIPHYFLNQCAVSETQIILKDMPVQYYIQETCLKGNNKEQSGNKGMWNITLVKYIPTESTNAKIKKSDKNIRSRPLSRGGKGILESLKVKLVNSYMPRQV